jgi:hypothetical protein
MARLIVVVEGQTEEDFVKEVLCEHLMAKGFESVAATKGGNPRLRHRGGIRDWQPFRTDIIRHLKEDRACVATTMIDYYGMPQSWPGRSQSASIRGAHQKAQCVEQALSGDMLIAIEDRLNPAMFVPFVVMHEFEGLLFSDCSAFSSAIYHPELRALFQEIRDVFASPEEINDSPVTAPSKRVQQLLPRYEKPLFGALAAIQIGLTRIRRECPHFADWLTRLEALAR